MSSHKKDRKTYCRQPWEEGSDRYSTEEMFSQSCKAKFLSEPTLVTEERKQMSLAPWEKGGVYVDDHDLENDDKIDDRFVIKYDKYSGLGNKLPKLLYRYPLHTFIIAGEEGFKRHYGTDNAGIAESFSEAGGVGIDRPGGLAFSFYQKFDTWKEIDKKTNKEKEKGPQEGTEANAARHTLWNMLNVQTALAFKTRYLSSVKEGLGAAKSAADLHEANPYALENKKMIFDPDDYKQSSSNPNDLNRRGCSPEDGPNACARIQADETTDLLNNQIGRNLGLQYPPRTSPRDLALGMLDYFYSKGLYTIHKIGGKYHVLRTKITKEQYEHMKNVYMNEVDELGRKIRKDEDFIPFLML